MSNRTQISRKLYALSLISVTLLLPSCARKPPKSPVDPKAYAQELSQWQQQRWTDLKSDNGWLTLVGLFWLREGENKFGSDKANDIVIPKLAAHAGSLFLEKGRVRIDAKQSGFTVDGKPIKSLELKSDEDEKPTVVHLDSMTFQIIKRGDRLGVRAKDSQNPDRLVGSSRVDLQACKLEYSIVSPK